MSCRCHRADPNLEIRVAKIADLGEILRVDLTTTAGGRRDDIIRQALHGGTCLIARQDGRAVGFATYDHSFFGRPYLSLLIVEPPRRRRGIATALLTSIEALLAGSDLFTSTNESNEEMRGLCVSLGYVESGRIENLDVDDPEIVYMKRLSVDATQADRMTNELAIVEVRECAGAAAGSRDAGVRVWTHTVAGHAQPLPSSDSGDQKVSLPAAVIQIAITCDAFEPAAWQSLGDQLAAFFNPRAGDLIAALENAGAVTHWADLRLSRIPLAEAPGVASIDWPVTYPGPERGGLRTLERVLVQAQLPLRDAEPDEVALAHQRACNAIQRNVDLTHICALRLSPSSLARDRLAAAMVASGERFLDDRESRSAS